MQPLLEALESRRLFATVHVGNFGAQPNDGASDTAAIQAAINASAAGDIIQFGSGQYDVTSVTLRGSRTYQGDGGTVVRTSAEWAFSGESNARDMLITRFRFEGAGIALGLGSSVSNIQILDNSFVNSPHVAIKLTVRSDLVTIERNLFQNIGGYGALLAYNVNRMSYSHNRLIDISHGGHILGPLDDCKFNYNHITGAKVMGLEIQRDSTGTSVSHNLEVVGNMIYDFKWPVYGAFGLSVIAEAGLNTQIRNNYIRNSFAPGTDFDTSLPGPYRQFGPAIEAGFDTGVVEGNVSGGPNTFTTHVGAAGLNMLVRNNKFYGTPGYGANAWILGWPSMYGQGTFIDENNLKDTQKSNTPPPPLSPQLGGDANGDGSVNLKDFNILSSNWGRSNASLSQGDFNGDTLVNLLDFNILSSNFGRRL